MFNKEKAADVARLYMSKYCDIQRLKKLVENGCDVNDEDLKLNSLLDVYFESTNRCNFSCKFCARESMQRSFYMLDKHAFKEAIQSLPRGMFISLSGNGEPTLNTDLYEMIDIASDSGMRVSLISNGSTLNEVNRNKLLHSGISRIQFSFQSIDRLTNEQIMRGSKFDRDLLNILKFIQLVRTNGSDIYIGISRVKINESEEYADLTRKFWESCSIDNYYEGELLTLQTNSGMYKGTEQCEYKPCANPWATAKVNANGDVNPCIQDFSSEYVIGNIYDNALFEILNSPKALEFRRASLFGDLEYLEGIGYDCKNCNTWRTPVDYDLDGIMNKQIPIRMGLQINELAADRPAVSSFLERAIYTIEQGDKDIVNLTKKEFNL